MALHSTDAATVFLSTWARTDGFETVRAWAAVVTFVFALIPARFARRSWVAPRREQTAAQRIGILLACMVAVALVAMRSYRWMGR